MKALLGFSLLALGIASAALASAPREVNVVGDLTPAGRKIPTPRNGRPLYYYPIIGGYVQLGDAVAGEEEPDPNYVANAIVRQLAKAGYIAISNRHPDPDLIVMMSWGYFAPQKWGDQIGIGPGQGGAVSATHPVQALDPRALAMVAGGNGLRGLDMSFDREDVMQRAREDRYFMSVTAYDAAIYAKKHKKLPMWQANMSLPSNGIRMVQAVEALAKAGTPFFGHETQSPKLLMTHTTGQGTVEVGTPTVKDYIDAPLPPSRSSSVPESRKPPTP